MSIRPIVVREEHRAPPRPAAARRDLVGTAQTAVTCVVLVFAGLVTLLASYHIYVHEYEQRWPSGHVYIETSESRVYLVQPTAVVDPPTPLAASMHAVATEVRGASVEEEPVAPSPTRTLPPTVVSDARAIAPTPRADVPLPPVALTVSAIGVDAPVRMVATDTLPDQPYVGWYFRSAFPATAGNVVLLGHVDGESAVFSRLGELQQGDEIRVQTRDQAHVYVVEWLAFVDAGAVEMIGPIEHPVLTLVTCAGEWDEQLREYDSRIVVRARYAAAEDARASR